MQGHRSYALFLVVFLLLSCADQEPTTAPILSQESQSAAILATEGEVLLRITRNGQPLTRVTATSTSHSILSACRTPRERSNGIIPPQATAPSGSTPKRVMALVARTRSPGCGVQKFTRAVLDIRYPEKKCIVRDRDGTRS